MLLPYLKFLNAIYPLKIKFILLSLTYKKFSVNQFPLQTHLLPLPIMFELSHFWMMSITF